MMALLPPSSRIERPNRPATASETLRPTLVDPVADINGSRRSCNIRSPTTDPLPTTRLKTPSNPEPAITLWPIRVTATAVSGVCDEGFQITLSPHTAAIAAFHDQTATGKLKAVITPTGPRGCHCSYIRWRGRSETIDRP